MSLERAPRLPGDRWGGGRWGTAANLPRHASGWGRWTSRPRCLKHGEGAVQRIRRGLAGLDILSAQCV